MKLTTPEISWHGKEPLFGVDFSSYNEITRLATAGADFYIRIWSVHTDETGTSKVDFRANLLRHTKAVNVVRFSPQGDLLASGGDDCFVILWKLNETSETDGFAQSSNLNTEDVESKESWQVFKMLRGHIEDVYDLAWSPNGSQLISGSVDNSVIIWATGKGDKTRILKDHRQYVQGVCWDPCGTYVASYSSDRTCRIYTTNNFKCCYNVNKVTLPNSSLPENGSQNPKQIKLFHDETMPSFFRRLTFSPDGSLLIVPGGRFEVNEQPINTTFVFTKASLNKPVMYFPATKKPTIAVRCCPVLFQLRKSVTENTEGNKEKENTTTFKLPYRMIIAVASLDSVVLYDTQHTCPFGFLSNMHYASLTDIAWSSDGQILAISSRDGYCSLVTFEKDELGFPYGQTADEVLKKVTPIKQQISVKKNISAFQTPETPKELSKEKDISPKIESLSIKKFVTVNPRPTSSNNNDVDKQKPSTTTPGPRRISFVTLKPAVTPQPKTTISPLPTTAPSTKDSSINNTNTSMEIPIKPIQPRRVGFVTLPASQSPLTRTEKPPVPLEPEVIVIKD